MVSSRTLNIKKKRKLLNEISNGFLLLFNASDNKIGRIPLIQLQGVKLNMENFIKWSRADERESIMPSLSTNDGDDMERIHNNCIFFTDKKR